MQLLADQWESAWLLWPVWWLHQREVELLRVSVLFFQKLWSEQGQTQLAADPEMLENILIVFVLE